MGETRVDLLHLPEDLRDAYPGSLEETIITEIVANSLDSRAAVIAVATDPMARTLTVSDDGSGMSRQALSRYHDLASTAKRRGGSIGFAGVGIKLGLLISEEVVTETRRPRTHLATSWRMSSRNRAPWRWIEPPGLQPQPGTTVRLYLSNPLSELLEPGFIETVLIRHFQPLLHSDFDGILKDSYERGIRFSVNGRPLARFAPDPVRVRFNVRIGRQRKPSGIGFLIRAEELAEDERGIAISTLGKVIKRGWDWLGLTPGDADRVSGLIEVPALVETLTLNKADFARSGGKGATFLGYRKAIQEAVADQLKAWGDAPQRSESRPRRTRAMERDLQSVLAGLAADFPLLATLVERRRGGQHKLPLGEGGDGMPGVLATDRDVASAEPPEPGEGADAGEPTEAQAPAAATPDAPALDDAPPATASVAAGTGGRAKAAHLGLQVRFGSRADDPSLGSLVESTVWVNDAHPAYRRAVAARSEGYHVALTVAMTLAPLAVEPVEAHAFINAFLRAWGASAVDGGR
jgi:hypothetical protein